MRQRRLLCWLDGKDSLLKVVAVGLQQPQGHHELYLLELSWPSVGHDGSSAS